MVVGTLLIEITLPGNHSLKGKRRIVRSLMDRVRNRFNVAVAEVDHLDAWGIASIGVACVSNERAHVDEVLKEVIRWVESNHDGDVTGSDIRIV